jgi:hypothetical protein
MVIIVKDYQVTCSSDAFCPEPIYFWGHFDTPERATDGIILCQKKEGCHLCSAEIHHVRVIRTRPTNFPYDPEHPQKLPNR